jgi:hypothetical protein
VEEPRGGRREAQAEFFAHGKVILL